MLGRPPPRTLFVAKGALLGASRKALQFTGRGTYQCFAESMNDEVARRLRLANDLRAAIPRDEFRLVYQPQFDSETGEPVNHPQVAEVAVFGVPDEKYGEQLGAWVKLRAGEATEPGALKAYAAERLARHEVPEYVWLVDELPRTSTGKVQKFRIRKTVAEWLDAPKADTPTAAAPT